MIEFAGGPEKAAIVALGILAVLVLLWMVLKRRRNDPVPRPPPGQSSAENPANATVLGVLSSAALKQTDPNRKDPSTETASTVTLRDPETAPPPDMPSSWSAVERAADWEARIEKAAAANDKALLASHHLGYAKAEIAAGRYDVAADQLRACLRIAAQSRNAPMEAHARMELAELARTGDDLTTACEHWQIARSLFHQLESAPELADVETRMRSHGCPTDWVLTDF
jgi:hypothetical protein